MSIYEEALKFHKQGTPGQLSITPTKPLTSQADLSLAYSPGVAALCLAIHENPKKAYEYTSKGNFVAVITNGTAVLGLGNLGALASKPVMEGKSVLLKRFADIDAIDLEVDTEDPQEFINSIKYLSPSWGGINLEDIKAPECFIIEEELKKVMDIPVFHDDQHGTAIITLAALINAADITNREFSNLKIVVNGAGAAAIACIDLIKTYGVKHENIILCDTKGVIYKGRVEGMNKWKERHAIDTPHRSLSEAMVGTDVFIGLSVKGAVTTQMIQAMNPEPIIFAMANPEPEISPEEVMKIRDDAIVATGRSDYNNQVNNVMGFPYIFRGALDVQASSINDEMKIAAAEALAILTRSPVPDEVRHAYGNRQMEYGKEYIIPVPFDLRLIYTIPPAVALAAMKSGVARKPINDFIAYKKSLHARLDPSVNSMNLIFKHLQTFETQKKIVFAEGEEDIIIRAASHWCDSHYGLAILIGRHEIISRKAKKLSVDLKNIQIIELSSNEYSEQFSQYLYEKQQRNGLFLKDCKRLIHYDYNIFASCLVACGEADGMVSGITKGYRKTFEKVSYIIHPNLENIVFSISALTIRGKTIFIADTSINELPSAEELADIACQTAKQVRHFGHEPRVAFLSFSSFGESKNSDKIQRIHDAVKIMDTRKVDFEYDGEISADVALNMNNMEKYPFCRLSAPANILIMPALHSANISAHLLQALGGASIIGPILCGLEKSVQIAPINASMTEIVNLAAFAAYDSI